MEPDGALLFTNYCQPCHTAAGTGSDHKIAAPNIAGLPQWYVEAQLHKFRDGVRGGHFDDITGMRMRPMSLTLTSDAEVTAVATHVSALPVVDAPEVTAMLAVAMTLPQESHAVVDRPVCTRQTKQMRDGEAVDGAGRVVDLAHDA